MRIKSLFGAFLVACLVAGCTSLSAPPLPTLLPTEVLPTVIALTLQAGEQNTVNATETPAPSLESTPLVTRSEETSAVMSTENVEVTQTPQPTATQTPTPQPTATLTSQTPVADIQIFRPGALSRVVSPVHVAAYLKPGANGRVLIELFGEEGELLFREVKAYGVLPGARVNLSMDLTYEIASVAEVGRLVISVKDAADRLVALNSVDLILLSVGEEDINPSSALQQTIIIEQPKSLSLVQGGNVVVSGLTRSDPEVSLRAEFIDEQGSVVGMRLVGISPSSTGDYNLFAAEVPYSVEKFTPVRLIVYEAGNPTSPIQHLSSLELSLSP
ncbi:MAG: hypothetical protein P8074_14580 [Anaerolineales bacterium]|jgi:hypothetical protein